jgi:agmatinase
MEFIHPGRPLWAQGEPASPRFSLLGVPFDGTSSFNPGSREGPLAIRGATHGLEDYSPVFGRSVPEGYLEDLGDLELSFGNPGSMLRRTEAAVYEIAAKGRIPFLLGGEHLVTLGALRALHRQGEFAIVQLDAHADLRDAYVGESLSHASVIYHGQELVGPGRVFQFGIRSGCEKELGRASFLREQWSPGAARDALEQIGELPIYLTIDIDVADPAFAPGTGTPEPGGWTSRELLEAVRLFGGRKLIGADIVEVLPSRDPAGITALLAAKCLREILIAQSGRDGDVL